MTGSSTQPHLRCPHVGLSDDPKTAFAYPSTRNACHKADPAAPVDLAHQQAYCLTAEHTACPIFQRNEAAPLPPELLGVAPGRDWRRYARWGVVAVILLLVAGLMWWFWPLSQAELAALLPPTRQPAAGGEFLPLPSASAVVTGSLTVPATVTDDLLLPAIDLPTPVPAVVTPTLPPAAVFTAAPAATTALTPTLTPSPPPLVTPSPTPPLTPQVSLTVSLPLRAGPGAGYPALATVEAAGYEILGRNAGGDWWLVCCTADGNAGWLPAAEVTVAGDAGAVAVATPALPIASVASEGVNVRAGPGTDYEVVAVADPNVDYRVAARNEAGNWWQICCLTADRSGWIFAELVAITGDTGSVPVAQDVPEPPPPTPAP